MLGVAVLIFMGSLGGQRLELTVVILVISFNAIIFLRVAIKFH